MSTVSEIIGEALLKLTGGVLTSDTATRWDEAKRYLVMASNFVQMGNYWNETKAEGERTVNPTLVQSFDNIAVEYSSDRSQNFSDLPKRILSLPKGRALEMKTQCGKLMIPMGQGDESMDEYYKCYKKNISYQIEGQRVWYWNMNRNIEGARAKYLVHLSELEDEDEVLLPSDGEVKVVEMMHGWLSGEKEAPKDYTVDGKDN